MTASPGLVCVAYNTTTSLAIDLGTLAYPKSRIILLTPCFPRCQIFIDGTNTIPIITTYAPSAFSLSLSTLRTTVAPGAHTIVIGSPGGPSNIILNRTSVGTVTTLLARGITRCNRTVAVLTSRPCHRLICKSIAIPCVPHCCGSAVMYCSCDGSLSLPNRHVNCVTIFPSTPSTNSAFTTIYNTKHDVNCIYTPDLLRGIIILYSNAPRSIATCSHGHHLLYSTLSRVNCRFTQPSNTFCLFVGTLRPSTGTFCRTTGGRRLLLIPDSDFNMPNCIHVTCYIDCRRVRHSLPTFHGLCRRCRRGWNSEV